MNDFQACVFLLTWMGCLPTAILFGLFPELEEGGTDPYETIWT